MSRTMELAFLKAQLGQVNEMLAELDGRPSMERPGLEFRRRKIEAQISKLGSEVSDRAAGVVTFSGQPVVGSKGILVKFAAQALRFLERAIVAATLPAGAAVASRGKLVGQEEHALYVTAIAFGSFGFELEEIKPRSADGQMELPGPSPLVFAMEQVLSLLQAASGDNEDAFALAVAGSNNRVQSSLRGFGQVLAREKAMCSFGVGDRRFELSTPEQLDRLHTRFASQAISHTDCTLTGKLFTLPEAHQFELHVDGETLSGRVDPRVPQDVLIQAASSIVTIQATKTTVATSGGQKVRLLLREIVAEPVNNAGN